MRGDACCMVVVLYGPCVLINSLLKISGGACQKSGVHYAFPDESSKTEDLVDKKLGKKSNLLTMERWNQWFS